MRKPRIDLNPSAADRWMTCTASPRYIRDNWNLLAESTDTAWNQEGTTAHEVAAAALQGRKVNAAACPVPTTKEMHRHAWNYMEYVEGLKGHDGAAVHVEQKLPLFYMQERNAMIDAVVVNHDDVHIVDYKYGEGVQVSPEGNMQCTIYAYVAVRDYATLPSPSTPVGIHIYQPRGRNAQTPAKVWSTTVGEIAQVATRIAATAQTIINNANGDDTYKVKFAPSEKACQFCPAKGFCVARQKHFGADVKQLAVIDSNPLPLSTTLTLEQRAAVLKHRGAIEKWLKDVAEDTQRLMTLGTKVPGWKLVMSNGGHRFWSDPAKAREQLLKNTILKREEVVTEKLVSPAEVEKLLGKKGVPVEVSNLIAKPNGTPIAVPEGDKRPSCIVNAEEEFDVVEDSSIMSQHSAQGRRGDAVLEGRPLDHWMEEEL